MFCQEFIEDSLVKIGGLRSLVVQLLILPGRQAGVSMNQVIKVRNISISEVGGDAFDFPFRFGTKSVTCPMCPNSDLIGFGRYPVELSKDLTQCSYVDSQFIRQSGKPQLYVSFGMSQDGVGNFGGSICLGAFRGRGFASLVILDGVFYQLVVNEGRKGCKANTVFRLAVRHWNPSRSLL